MAAIFINNKDRLVEFATAALLILISLTGLTLYLKEYSSPALLLLAFPAILLLVSSPKWAACFFIFSIYFNISVSQNPRMILCDLMALILLLSFTVDYLLKDKVEVRLPSIYKQYLLLFFAIVIVSIFSYNYLYSITPLLRIVVQFSIILAIFNSFELPVMERLIKLFFWIPVVQAVYNLCYYVSYGGNQRMFGYAGAYYDDLSMLALPVGLAYFIWSKTKKTAYIYGFGTLLLLIGLIATHSRASLFTPDWVGAIIIVFSAYRARRLGLNNVLKRIKFIILLIIILVLSVLFSGFFEGFITRIEGLSDIRTGTVWLRMSLWSTSWNIFLENPITGLGPGAFRYIEDIYPVLRFDAARLYLDEASAHNLFLHYLGEAGLIGTLALLALYLKNLISSVKLSRFTKHSNRTPMLVAMFGAGLSIFGSIFYMDGWMWGQNAHAAPLFFAVTAKLICDKYKPDNT